MSRGKDFREPRRRGFDDDHFSPRGDSGFGMPRPSYGGPPRPAATGPMVDAVVKWFNPEKGFGFVELADGTGDAFLHVAVLEATGRKTVLSGAKVKARVGQGQKGPQVTEVIEVDESTATAQPARRHGPLGPRPQRAAPDLSSAIEMSGTVKWYNPDKGFGFVAIGDGGKDVFVHASVLQRAGIADLAEGQRVTMQVVEGMKGREAAAISAVG
ncbi:MAG: CspA family cold shock protein [Alphaproteobacteria bacterium]|nr:CspA family cold shock protein [Alphaproteobacteria bacterium]